MRPLRTFLVAGLIVGNAMGDLGPIPGTEKIAPVFEGADLVCNCVVESLRTTEEQRVERGDRSSTLRHVIARVRVKDIYKNSVRAGAAIDVAFEEEIPTTSSMPTLTERETAVMFLKASSVSIYEFADRFLGATPFTFLPAQQTGEGLSRLQSALTGVLEGGSHNDQLNAMRLLEGFDELSSETLRRVNVLSKAADPETALSSIAVLLKARQPGSVRKLESYLRTRKTGPVPVAVLSIGGELGQVSDNGDLDALETLTSSELLSIKLGAMAGVRHMRNPHSAKVLVERLDDPSSDIRFLAVITLSEIFSKEGDYAPTMYLFDQNPDFYVVKWKTWWAGEGRELTRQ